MELKNEIKITAPEVTAADVAKVVEKASIGATDKPAPLLPAERIPANWHIEAMKADKIQASNNISGRVFEGTIKEFSDFIKG